MRASFGLAPLGDRVLLRELLQEESKTAAGIYIPETVKEDRGAKKGIVVAVGEGRYEDGKLIPVQVKIDEKVLFQWGDKIMFNDEEYYLVKESEIVARVR